MLPETTFKIKFCPYCGKEVPTDFPYMHRPCRHCKVNFFVLYGGPINDSKQKRLEECAQKH
jgi:tRNA G26 N,N-dimethylase Trm1